MPKSRIETIFPFDRLTPKIFQFLQPLSSAMFPSFLQWAFPASPDTRVYCMSPLSPSCCLHRPQLFPPRLLLSPPRCPKKSLILPPVFPLSPRHFRSISTGLRHKRSSRPRLAAADSLFFSGKSRASDMRTPLLPPAGGEKNSNCFTSTAEYAEADGVRSLPSVVPLVSFGAKQRALARSFKISPAACGSRATGCEDSGY